MIPAVRASSCCRSIARRGRAVISAGASRISSAPGLGLTIGAKVAAPDKFCVNFMGDAAFGMTGLDFETAVRCGVPICTIVLNNSAMAIEIPHMKLSHEKLSIARSGRQLRQPGARPRRLERAGGGSVAGRRCDPACAAADGGGQGVPARVRHQPGDGVLAARGVMEEAEELERAAEWRMRKVDADPSDATSREAAALLERLGGGCAAAARVAAVRRVHGDLQLAGRVRRDCRLHGHGERLPREDRRRSFARRMARRIYAR